MKHLAFKSLISIFIVVVLMFALAVSYGMVHAEEAEEEEPVYIPLYVTNCTALNCRQKPSKSSFVVTELERGQMIEGTGRWSRNKQWVEVYHPEFGNLWCDYHYLTERQESFSIETLWETPIKIRKNAMKGKVTGRLKRDQKILITQVIYGWGKCSKGWIDLAYCIEIGE